MQVSVVIPAYNRRAFVGAAIESALAQTLPAVEVIVVDDASTDGTADAVARTFGSRVRLIRLPRHAGRSAARNAGWAAAQAPLVAFLDSDDVWLPEKLARQLPSFGDPSVLLVHARVGLVDESLALLREETAIVQRAFEQSEIRGFDYAGITATWCRMYTPAVVVRRSALEATGGFDPALDRFEDWDLFWRIARMGRVVTIPEVLVHVRKHAHNAEPSWRDMAAPWLRVNQQHLAALDASPTTSSAPALPLSRDARRRARHNLLVNLALGAYWQGDRRASRAWMWRALREDLRPLFARHHVVWGAPLLHALLPASLAAWLVEVTRVDAYRLPGDAATRGPR